MEDHALDLIIGEGPSARSIRIDLAPFTLVAATTRAGLLATPLRDRFGIPIRLEFYTPDELQRVLAQAARKMGARPRRRTAPPRSPPGRAARPRVAGRLLRRVRDFAAAEGAAGIDRACAARGLARLEVDAAGLDALDRRYLARPDRELWRRAGRGGDPGLRHRRGPGRGGGRDRALPAAAGLHPAHAARPPGLRQGLCAPGPDRAAGPEGSAPARSTRTTDDAASPPRRMFEGREHRLPVRVYYEDTDFTGVVYHANYVRYFERGRSDFLRLAGVGHAELLARPDPCAFVRHPAGDRFPRARRGSTTPWWCAPPTTRSRGRAC